MLGLRRNLALRSALSPRQQSLLSYRSRSFRAQCVAFSTSIRPLDSGKTRNYATVSSATSLHAPPDPVDSFLQSGSSNYVDSMYNAWRRNPSDVHVSWQAFFENMENTSISPTAAFQPPPGLIDSQRPTLEPSIQSAASIETLNTLKAQRLVQSFRDNGHTQARIDPLTDDGQSKSTIADNLQTFGFGENDLDTRIRLGPELFPELASQGLSHMSLRDIISTCENIYCRSIGVEINHVSDPQKREWLRSRLEAPLSPLSVDDKKRILATTAWGTILERFLASKFPGEKRFGLDGSEGQAPGLAALIDQAVDVHGAKQVVVGSCHRGRMNVFSTVYGRPHEKLFNEFAGMQKFEASQSGDVRYHFGMDGTRTTAGGNSVDISVLPNPSHLECIDPVAQGKTRAVQSETADVDRSSVLPLALHGDAAFSGQGPVYETLNMAALPGYGVGGTVRLAINNQIGFTTDAANSRSTTYCTDVMKYMQAPVFHVNADDAEAVVRMCRLAVDWRAAWKEDIMVDLVCYRRYGHNDIDQPSFTQPEMYRRIADRESLLELYSKKVVDDGAMTAEAVQKMQDDIWQQLEEKLARSRENSSAETSTEGLPAVEMPETGVSEDTLSHVAIQITSAPSDFVLHKNIQRILTGLKKDFESGTVQWSTAEALAFGSLLLEGHPVRISGQDVERGTFSQRHSVLHDQNTFAKYTPLNNLNPGNQATYSAINSPLSEFGVMGFEYGYSLAAKDSLVIWEAQFGDFANNAQVIIDQFISSGEAKWLLKSGLVLSLPHGFDGMGSEHSSARPSRFLELGNEQHHSPSWDEALQREECNMQIVCMTTPANLFHVLRRQAHLPNKKPLVILFSKSLLRHPLGRSTVSDLSPSAGFQPVIADPQVSDFSQVKRVILCSGQVFMPLSKYQEANTIDDTAICRIEEMHPFPWSQLRAALEQYPRATELVWCQEEPYNGGAWHYMRDRIETLVGEMEDGGRFGKLKYAGRKAAAAPATGSKKVHMHEEEVLVQDAFEL